MALGLLHIALGLNLPGRLLQYPHLLIRALTCCLSRSLSAGLASGPGSGLCGWLTCTPGCCLHTRLCRSPRAWFRCPRRFCSSHGSIAFSSHSDAKYSPQPLLQPRQQHFPRFYQSTHHRPIPTMVRMLQMCLPLECHSHLLAANR